MPVKAIPVVPGASAEEFIGQNPGAVAVLYHGRRLVGRLPSTNLRGGDQVYLVFDDNEELKGMKPVLTSSEFQAKEQRVIQLLLSDCPFNIEELKANLTDVLPRGLDDVILGTFFKELAKKHDSRVTSLEQAARKYFQRSSSSRVTTLAR
jgi:hypothetical protein